MGSPKFSKGFYNPEIKAMIISSTKNSHVETDSDCRGNEEIKKKFTMVKVIKSRNRPSRGNPGC